MLVTAVVKVPVDTLRRDGFSGRATCVATGAETAFSRCEDLVAFLAAQAAVSEAAGGTRHDRSVHLTARQRRVLGLLAAGRTNAEIARDLGIAQGTVRKHLEETYRRLGVRNRTEAVAYALGFGVARGSGTRR